MSRKSELVFLAVAVIILMPLLFLPISNDLAIYVLAGKTIARGGKIYSDFIDVKTPVFFYIHALSCLLFGSKEISPRILDFLWQLSTVLSLRFVVGRLTGVKGYGISAGIVYALLYSTLNFSQTFHSESLAGLPLAWLIYFFLKQGRSPASLAVIGLLAGFVTSLKYSMGIILPVIFIYDLFNSGAGLTALIKRYLYILSGMIIALALCFSPLLDPDVFKGFISVNRFLVQYSGYTSYNLTYIKHSLKDISGFFGDYYSLFLSACYVIGISFVFKRYADPAKDKASPLITISALAAFMLLVSVVVERKFTAYFFSRMFMPLSVISGVGLVIIVQFIRLKWKESDINIKMLTSMFLAASLFFSPLPRWIGVGMVGYYYFADQGRYDSIYQSNSDILLKRVVHKQIASLIKKNSNSSQDKVFIMAIGATEIYILAGTDNFEKYAMSNQYFNRNPVNEWVNDLPEELRRTVWLLVLKDDNHPNVRGIDISSWQGLQNDSSLFKQVVRDFYKFRETGSFILFKRKSGT